MGLLCILCLSLVISLKCEVFPNSTPAVFRSTKNRLPPWQNPQYTTACHELLYSTGANEVTDCEARLCGHCSGQCQLAVKEERGQGVWILQKMSIDSISNIQNWKWNSGWDIWSVLWVYPSVSTSWMWLENPQRKAARRILNRHPNHLSWLLLMWRSSGSTPSSLRMSELLTLSGRARLLFKGSSFRALVSDHSLFQSLHKAQDHGWELELVLSRYQNSKLCLVLLQAEFRRNNKDGTELRLSSV